MKKELDNMGAFLNMVVDYKQKIGSNAQLMIEPKPREPCKHQYDYDAQTVIGFLHEYGEEHRSMSLLLLHGTQTNFGCCRTA